jgi:hypothetical protein
MSGCMGDIGTHAAQLAEYILVLKLLNYALILTSLSKVENSMMMEMCY